MSILSDLKAERSRLVAGADMVIVPGRTLDVLIAVAEAARPNCAQLVIHGTPDGANCGQCQNLFVCAALAPLMKEATDE